MDITTVTDGIFRLFANVKDILFEGIWPIPNGVVMNSFIVRGEKAAIIDGVCGWDGVPETLFAQLEKMDIKLEDIDYVVINHMEPDHSGWLEDFLKIRGTGFSIVCSPKAAVLLKSFFDVPDINIIEVNEGDEIDLGGGKILTFVEIPNVHWPETIATFEKSTGTLMPCDAFGSFGEITNAPYDDMLSQEEIDYFENEAVRYYANIVAAFSFPTGKAIEKVESLGDALNVIAPGHGIVWRKDPWKIVNDYKRYVAYQKNPAKKEVTLIWGSMYGMTEKAIPSVLKGLNESGVTVHEHRVPDSHIGDILASIWTSTGVVLAMPTYEYKMFPPMFAVLDELGKKRAQGRLAFRLGSFGWSGGAQRELDELLDKHKMKWDFLEPVEFKGKPTPEDLELIEKRAAKLGKSVIQAVESGEVVQV